jgi:hypothetical protein
MLRSVRLGVSSVAVVVVLLAVPSIAGADSLVTFGSPSTMFPRDKQNEPAVAIDPMNPSVVVAGANEEIDVAPCNGSSCPFTHGVGTSGYYLSLNGGMTWTQPTYKGFSARSGTGTANSNIGTLPNYDTAGLVSDGDPALAFGPAPGTGGFSWSNGVRLYYSNLASNFSTTRTDQAFKGFEAIAVSHTDNLTPTTAVNSDWSAPVIVSSAKQSASTFSDKPDVWADNAASSPHFGAVYECYTDFRSKSTNSFSEPIMFSRSTDGGSTWSTPAQLTQATNNNTSGGRQDCAIQTGSDGTVYVFFDSFVNKHAVQMLTRSFNGGVSFERPRPVASVVNIGGDSATDFDGLAGARSSSYPSVSIANGAPYGTTDGTRTGPAAPNTIALAWADAANGLNNERLLFEISTDGGNTFSAPQNAADGTDRPVMPAVALSPDGTKIYFTYNAFVQPFETSVLTPARDFEGVLRQGSVDSSGAVSGLTTVSRGSTGDARASSANALADEFLGDYNSIAANAGGAVAVYIDARNAAACAAIDEYREDLISGQTATAPAPATACADHTFGNTDIFAASAGTP